MSIAEKLLQIAEGVREVYSSGEEARQRTIDAKQYIGTFRGNGDKSITVPMPFLPDAVAILSYDPTVQRLTSSYVSTTYDRRSFGDLVAGLQHYNKDSMNILGNVFIASTAQKVFTFDTENKQMTFTPPNKSTYANLFWSTETEYKIVAFRYAGEKTDKELLIEAVANLDDSTGGTYTFSKHRVNQTVTDAEWDEIISAKPNLTFILY